MTHCVTKSTKKRLPDRPSFTSQLSHKQVVSSWCCARRVLRVSRSFQMCCDQIVFLADLATLFEIFSYTIHVSAKYNFQSLSLYICFLDFIVNPVPKSNKEKIDDVFMNKTYIYFICVNWFHFIRFLIEAKISDIATKSSSKYSLAVFCN